MAAVVNAETVNGFKNVYMTTITRTIWTVEDDELACLLHCKYKYKYKYKCKTSDGSRSNSCCLNQFS